ncbi:MAG TPA: enoyl-CoA hydratase-related protein [Anaerolineales bacterium]|nr:enoyl-CoA hydratase-related protein [Anaerolineales bacterium]
MAETIHTQLNNGILFITIDHPKANALSLEMIQSLQKAFHLARQEKQARVVLLRSEGENFSAGQDVYEMLQAEGQSYRKHMLETYNPLILQIRRLEKPVIAEIQGTVAGAALGLVLACDLRIASENARFLVGFLGIGLALDSGVSLFLPAIIGLGRATEVAFTNQPITAEQALSWGLVNRVVPTQDLHTSAIGLAMAVTNGPVHAMGLAKRDFNYALFSQLEQVLDYEAHIQEVARVGTEHKEGKQAFVAKRTPNWMSC